MASGIDFTLPRVDGNDPVWQEKNSACLMEQVLTPMDIGSCRCPMPSSFGRRAE